MSSNNESSSIAMSASVFYETFEKLDNKNYYPTLVIKLRNGDILCFVELIEYSNSDRKKVQNIKDKINEVLKCWACEGHLDSLSGMIVCYEGCKQHFFMDVNQNMEKLLTLRLIRRLKLLFF